MIRQTTRTRAVAEKTAAIRNLPLSQKTSVTERQASQLIAIMYDWQENLARAFEPMVVAEGDDLETREAAINEAALTQVRQILNDEQHKWFQIMIHPHDLANLRPIEMAGVEVATAH